MATGGLYESYKMANPYNLDDSLKLDKLKFDLNKGTTANVGPTAGTAAVTGTTGGTTGGTFLGMGSNGWGATGSVLSGIGSIGSIYLGMQGVGLMEDQLALQEKKWAEAKKELDSARKVRKELSAAYSSSRTA